MRLKLLPFLIVGLIVACSEVVHAQWIVAHRGASYDAPENTLAAFRLAWEKKADAIEGDFYLTKDGEIVCIHDKTTKRVAPGQRVLNVKDSTLDELKTLDVGSWKHERYALELIPTLKEVLSTVPEGKRIFIEIKCGPEIVPTLKRQIEDSGLKVEQAVVICFDEDVIARCRKVMPDVRANWLTGYDRKTLEDPWTPSSAHVLDVLKRSGATGLGSKADLQVLHEDFVELLKGAEMELHVWTVNDPRLARKFADLGAISVTTDRPGLIRTALENDPPSDSR